MDMDNTDAHFPVAPQAILNLGARVKFLKNRLWSSINFYNVLNQRYYHPDPFYDLAVLAVFLRMDEGTCLRLLSAYDDRQAVELPSRLRYTRRLVAALAGTMQLHLAQKLKHPGASGAETPATALALGEFYQQLRTGTLQLGTAAGQWAFGLSLIRECLAL